MPKSPIGKPLTGQTFIRLDVLSYAGKSKSGNSLWLCRCVCGTEKVVVGSNLKRGHTTSCGCYQRERTSEANTTNGLTGHPLSNTHDKMISRCYTKHDPSYGYYGGREENPIGICDRWRGPNGKANFIADMESQVGPGLTLDRRDNDADYSPENCRFATRKAQARNRRSNSLVPQFARR